MFKSAAIWRIDRNSNRTKSIFKLHFRVTQVPVLVGDALLVSVIPKDVGKPTNRLEKGVVRDGICCWQNPVYETVRFVRDLKTGKFNQKIYYFIVSTGNQKSSVVGEVSIDFADYAELSKPSFVSLPFRNPQCTAVLHITIQRMQEQAELRSFAECEDVKVKLEERIPNASLGELKYDEKEISHSDQGTIVAITAFENVESNGNTRISNGSEVFSCSDSTIELATPREIVQNVHHGHTSLQSSPSCDSLTHKPMTNRLALPNQELQQQQSECSVSFDGFSTDGSTISSKDSTQKQGFILATNAEIDKLKSDLVILARQAEFSGLELQTLRKQIVKESKRSNELAREIINLKEERDELKAECENLKAAQKHVEEAKVENSAVRNPLVLIEELRQELRNERNFNANLKLQLQKTQDSNTELILAVQDLDEMLEKKNNDMPNLSHKAQSCELVPNRPELTFKCNIQQDEELNTLEELVHRHEDAEDANILEHRKAIGLYHEMEICRRDRDDMEMQMEQLALDYEILKQENQEMAYKLEQSQLQEQLKVQYECSYTSVNELEGQIEGLENELRNQEKQYADSLTKITGLHNEVACLEDKLEKQARGFEGLENELRNQEKQYADSLTKITELQNEVACLEDELEKQARGFEGLENEFRNQEKQYADSLTKITELQNEVAFLEDELEKHSRGFEADLESVVNAKVEQEQRAILAEEALRVTKKKNANTAEQLQRDFKRIFVQLCKTFDENEKISLKSMNEVAELRREKNCMEILLNNATAELNSVKNDYESKLDGLSNQIKLSMHHIDEMKAEADYKINQLEAQILQEKEMNQDLSQEMLMLRVEIQRLIEVNNVMLNEKDILKAELEQAKTSNDEAEMSLIGRNVELSELEDVIALISEKTEKSMEDLVFTRSLLKEKESALADVESELEDLKAQCNILKQTSSKDVSEKENLLKQVLQLKRDIENKENELSAAREKLKEINGCLAAIGGTNVTQNGTMSHSFGGKNMDSACLMEKILAMEENIDGKVDKVDCIMDQGISKITSNPNQNGLETLLPQSDQRNLNTMTSEMEKLMEKNMYMEMELKELQGRYSEISLKFAEVEGERQKLVMSLRYHKSSRKR